MKSTLIVATVLAAALVSASAVPAFAARNTGAFNQSAEANNGHLQSYCKLAKNAFAQDVRKLNNTTPGTQEHADARTIANETLGNAWAAGCAWAQ